MFYQLPHVLVSLIPSIDPLYDLFLEETFAHVAQLSYVRTLIAVYVARK